MNFLDLMFKDGEKINLSVSKYDTSICFKDEANTNEGVLLCLNPLNDTRKDANVSAYRNFLIEVDTMSLKDQLNYIKELRVPYSCCVFSGNKSLHFGIFLDEDLPNEVIYRYLAQWILNIVTKADQNCKNPSRMIRYPNNVRPDTGLKQSLIEMKEKVSLSDLYNWLNRFPDKKPLVEHPKERVAVDGEKLDIPAWVKHKLVNGLDLHKSRNSQWFGIGCEFAKAGYSIEETLGVLSNYYTEESDFNQKEWELAVCQGFRQKNLGNKVSFR